MGLDPNWVVAGVTAGGSGLAAYRGYTRLQGRRKARQSEYQRLYHTVFGWPAQHDEDGYEYEPARPGIIQRYADLESRFGGHREHPPGADHDRARAL